MVSLIGCRGSHITMTERMPLEHSFQSTRAFQNRMCLIRRAQIIVSTRSGSVNSRFGYRLNNSFQDNRQVGRANSDFRTLINAITFGVTPHRKLELNFDFRYERATNFEVNRLDRTWRATSTQTSKRPNSRHSPPLYRAPLPATLRISAGIAMQIWICNGRGASALRRVLTAKYRANSSLSI